jgi:hypothetical protein
VSASRKQEPVSLAREIEITPGPSVTATWSTFMVTTPPQPLGERLATLLETHAEAVPTSLVETVGRLLRRTAGLDELTTATTRTADGITLRGGRSPFTHEPAQGSDLETTVAVSQALLLAFPTVDELEELLLLRLDRHIQSISDTSGPMIEITRALTVHAAREGWLTQLVTAAVQARPSNELLARAAARLSTLRHGGNGLPPSKDRCVVSRSKARQWRPDVSSAQTLYSPPTTRSRTSIRGRHRPNRYGSASTTRPTFAVSRCLRERSSSSSEAGLWRDAPGPTRRRALVMSCYA